jgi:hypothetical protein
MSYPDENFDRLQRLLGCKRYEQPPPGYFGSFSDKVISRIEAQDLQETSSWWRWFLERFDAKPVLVCAYGFAVSGMLLTGFHLSQAFEAEAATPHALAGPWLATTPVSPALFAPAGMDAEFIAATVLPSSARARAVLRDPAHFPPVEDSLRFQPVNHTLGGW